jgi:hypothetical protein
MPEEATVCEENVRSQERDRDLEDRAVVGATQSPETLQTWAKVKVAHPSDSEPLANLIAGTDKLYVRLHLVYISNELRLTTPSDHAQRVV